MTRVLADRRQGLNGLTKLMNSLSYKGVLARGYTLVTNAAGELVRSVGAVGAGEALTIEFADGRIGAHADGAPPAGEPQEPVVAPARKRPRGSPGDEGQQSLF